MRIRLVLRPVQDCVIPVEYRSHIQGLIYQRLKDVDVDFSTFLHNHGYQALRSERARFKFFCFSSLLDHAGYEVPFSKKRHGLFCTSDQLYTLLFSSPLPFFTENILYSLFESYLNQEKPFVLGKHSFRVEVLDFEVTPMFSNQVPTLFRCLGGGFVARAQPGLLPDNKTYLTMEHGDMLAEALGKNLRMKMETLFQPNTYPTDPLYIRLLPNPKLDVVGQSFGYRFTHGSHQQVVVGSPVRVVIQGPSSWLQMAWCTGLGEKNSQGMGMIEILPDEIDPNFFASDDPYTYRSQKA